MFLADGDVDGTCLRQGDILKDVVFPLLAAEEVVFLGTIDPQGSDGTFKFRPKQVAHRKSAAWQCQLLARMGFAAVISQCCDLEPRHGKILQPTIALARLIDVPKSIANDSERLKSLAANKYPLNPGDPGYLNYFYVSPHDRLEERGWVVDYNQVLSIPSSEFPVILGRKILQMTDDFRIRFKIKLATSYGRFTDDEEKSGHPWLADHPAEGESTIDQVIQSDPVSGEPIR
jgi:hypothetical protein